MDTAQEILRDFNAQELETLWAQGHWGYFRTVLADVEMVVASREFVPEWHPAKVGLQGILYRSLGIMDSACQQRRGHVTSKMLCPDQMRLVNLFGALRGLPQARARVKKILNDEIQNDTDAVNNLGEIPGCKDPQAHRSLLGIYIALGSGDTENNAVENATIKAFLTHNRKAQQAIEASQRHQQTRVFIDLSADEHDEGVWPVPVRTIKLRERSFDNVSIYFIHKPAKVLLELYIQEQLSGQGLMKLGLDTSALYTICYTASKTRIALGDHSKAEPYIIDVSMHSTREGQMLIEKLKILSPIFSSDTLDNVKQEEPSPPKRKLDGIQNHPLPARTRRRGQ